MPTPAKRSISIVIGLVIALLFWFVNPFGVDVQAKKVLSIGTLMITWWVTEALPMPAVALLPLILFPLTGIASLKETAVPYADPIIFLFMGGFMLGLAIEKWNLHKRIALNIVRITGTSGDKIVLGFIIATGFISMWLSNTATTMMMFPIAMSVIHVIRENHRGDGNVNNLAAAVMMAIAYASNFGGIATIIGTPPNVAFVGFIEKKYNGGVNFIDWMLICTPLAAFLLYSLYLVMTKWLYPNRIGVDEATNALIKTEIKNLGKLSGGEIRVLIIFLCTASLWIFKDLINTLELVKLDDTIIAMMGALALFICPAGVDEKGEARAVLEWKDTSKMAWGILLLFGGGITLAAALEKAGLIGSLGVWIAGFSGDNILLLIFMIALISTFLSEVMSNVAQVIVFAPVIGGIADALQVSPLLLGLPMTLGASCASMLPMGTPPNAIVFSSGQVKLKQMLRTGFVMNIVCVVLITLFCYFLVPVLMKTGGR